MLPCYSRAPSLLHPTPGNIPPIPGNVQVPELGVAVAFVASQGKTLSTEIK